MKVIHVYLEIPSDYIPRTILEFKHTIKYYGQTHGYGLKYR